MGEPFRLQAMLGGGMRYTVATTRYRKGSRTVYHLHYHLVFIPKYRKLILKGEVGLRTRELIREICRRHDIAIIQGHVRPDHVHLLFLLCFQVCPRAKG